MLMYASVKAHKITKALRKKMVEKENKDGRRGKINQ